MSNIFEITLLRFTHDEDCTGGLLYLDDKFSCFTVEDQPQTFKVVNETRIPQGTYRIKKREVLSGLTQVYRNTRDWFDWHLELQDVPHFEYVYIHNGVDDDSSSGCIIIGDNIMSEKGGNFKVGNSKKCFERIWKQISEEMGNGKEVYITIKDEQFLVNPF